MERFSVTDIEDDKTTATSNMALLPPELWLQVIDILGTQDLTMLQATNTAFRELVATKLWTNVEINLDPKDHAWPAGGSGARNGPHNHDNQAPAADDRHQPPPPSPPSVRQSLSSSLLSAKHPLAGEGQWTRHPLRCKAPDGRGPWIVIKRKHLDQFFDALESGSLSLVAPWVMTINIVEDLSVTRTTAQDGRVMAVSRRQQRMDTCRKYVDKLAPEMFPRLKLIRVSCAITGSMSLHFLNRFQSVEKYVWAQEFVKPTFADSYLLKPYLAYTTSLSVALQTQGLDDSIVTSFAPILAQVETLQLYTRRRTDKCVIEARKLYQMLGKAKALRLLSLKRVEVDNFEGINWLPEHVTRLRIYQKEDGRRIDDNNDIMEFGEQTVMKCPQVTSLYVDLIGGKYCKPLQEMEVTNLESLFYKEFVKQELVDEGVAWMYDVALFQQNPKLRRVVYNCSSSVGISALARCCGGSLEVLTLQRPVAKSWQVLPYDIDALSVLAKRCTNLRFLSVSASPRNLSNAIVVIKEFITHCATLQEVIVVSIGEFNCKGASPMKSYALDDGIREQYLRRTRKARLYRVDLEVFKKSYLEPPDSPKCVEPRL